MAANGAGEWASCGRTQSGGEEDGGPVQQKGNINDWLQNARRYRYRRRGHTDRAALQMIYTRRKLFTAARVRSKCYKKRVKF
jgi:hypothetical protein